MLDGELLKAVDGKSLLFKDERQRNSFELGVACAIFMWDDLATAVANGWGGPDSAEKREWLAGAVVDMFDAKELTLEELEVTLLAAMEEEFDVTLETDTAGDIADLIFQVYEECANGRFASIQALYDNFQKRQPAGQKVEVQNGIREVEDSEESEDESQETQQGQVKEEEEVPQLMDVEDSTPKGPVVDEEGFTIVQKRGRR